MLDRIFQLTNFELKKVTPPNSKQFVFNRMSSCVLRYFDLSSGFRKKLRTVNESFINMLEGRSQFTNLKLKKLKPQDSQQFFFNRMFI